MSHEVFVSGVGMIPFVKPGTSGTYQEMGEQAVRLALEDSGASYDQVQQVYAGYVYGDSTCGQAAVYRLGMSGIPVINVNNNCSTGSTALFLARQAIEGGVAECVLALGFEQMNPGALGAVFEDRPNPLEKLWRRFRHGYHIFSDVPILPRQTIVGPLGLSIYLQFHLRFQ